MKQILWRTVVVFASLATSAPAIGGQRAPCPPLDSTAKWARVNREWTAGPRRAWSNDSLRQVLHALAAEDQDARKEFGARVLDSAYVRQLMTQDSARSATLIGIIDRAGLPTRSMVGPDGADAAMLIVQHAVPALQERVLDLTRGIRRGELSPQALAMLEDRVLVHQKKPQRFGTQFTLSADGLFRFAPAADLDGLAARREQAGLPPLDLYVCFMEEAGMRIDRNSLPGAQRIPGQ